MVIVLTPPQAPRPIQRKFKSARLVGLYEKPWLQDRSYKKRERFDKVILGVCAFIGFAIAAVICWTEWNKLPVYDARSSRFRQPSSLLIAVQYCLVLSDNFATIKDSVWTHEVGVGGFG